MKNEENEQQPSSILQALRACLAGTLNVMRRAFSAPGEDQKQMKGMDLGGCRGQRGSWVEKKEPGNHRLIGPFRLEREAPVLSRQHQRGWQTVMLGSSSSGV